MKMQDLTSKVAVITGASSGFGEAAARLLASEGVHVVLTARRGDRLRALAAELGDSATVIETDVTNPAQVTALFAAVQAKFGRLDLLFNNAGLGLYSPFAASEPEQWRQMIDANLYGVLNCTKAAIPLMRGREGALIATVSSTAGRAGVEGFSVYCATKFAVVGFHDALRKELAADRIRVCVIEPGAAWTEFGANMGKARDDTYTQLEALVSDDIAQALVYAFAQRANVVVAEILVRPILQMFP